MLLPFPQHVRWFVPDDQFPIDWDRLVSVPVLLVVICSAALLAGLWVLQRALGSPHFPNPEFLRYMEPSATTLLAVQTGISLVHFATERRLFVEDLELGSNAGSWALIAAQVLVAVSLITGLFDRAGALLLVPVWLAGFLFFSPADMLGQVLYVGIGIALFVLGRTIPPPAIARKLIDLQRYERHAVVVLRVLSGLSIATVAFTEKLLAPDAGVAFLQDHPNFNFAREFLGMQWFTDERFTLAAGIAEATIGILLISGLLTRLVILAMLVPFNITVAFLPPVELLGHLPIFGIMFVLLLYGSGQDPKAAERRLEPAIREDAQPEVARPRWVAAARE